MPSSSIKVVLLHNNCNSSIELFDNIRVRFSTIQYVVRKLTKNTVNRAIPYHTKPDHALPYHTVPYHPIPQRIIPYRNVSSPPIPSHPIRSTHPILSHPIPSHPTPYHTIYTILQYTRPYKTIRNHAIPGITVTGTSSTSYPARSSGPGHPSTQYFALQPRGWQLSSPKPSPLGSVSSKISRKPSSELKKHTHNTTRDIIPPLLILIASKYATAAPRSNNQARVYHGRSAGARDP